MLLACPSAEIGDARTSQAIELMMRFAWWTATMTTTFVRSWKPLACRGVIGVSFGVLAVLWPEMTLAVLVLLFGVYALLDGIVAIIVGAQHRAREHAWTLLLEGAAGVGLGLAILFWARTAAALVVILIALWAIATGILALFAAIRLRRDHPDELLLGIAGATSVTLGCTILFRPAAGTIVLVVLLGPYAFVFGAAMLLQALRLRSALRSLEQGPHATVAKSRPV